MPEQAILASVIFTFVVMLLTAVVAVRSEEQNAELGRRIAAMKLEIERLEREVQRAGQNAAESRKELSRLADEQKRNAEEWAHKITEITKKKSPEAILLEATRNIEV